MCKNKSMKALTLFLFSFPLIVFAIRNGQKVEKDYVGKISIGKSICTAVRVHEDHFLSVAHCFTQTSASSFKIKYKNGGKEITEKIQINDVIIKGHSTGEELTIIPINPKLDPLENEIIDISLDLPNQNDILNAYGYGYDHNGNSGSLKLGELSYKSMYVNDGHLMMITKPGDKNQLPCPGDSGGPLLNQDGLIALVSFINNSDKKLDPEKEEQRQRRRRNFSFNKYTYVCKEANQAYYILLREHLDFLNQHLNLN